MRKILAGIDLSEHAQRACATAIALARRDGAEVILAMVTMVPDSLVETPSDDLATSWNGALHARLAQERAELETYYEGLRGCGVTISKVVRDGYADEQLPALARELGADLIVVGSHGRTGMARVMLGSVAERVVRDAPCPVLVARGGVPDGGYHTILVATDLAATSAHALALVPTVAAPGATVTLAHAMPATAWIASADGFAGVGIAETLRQDAERHAKVAGQAAIDQLQALGHPTTLAVRDGHAGEAVIHLASAAGADIIIAGTHGRRGLSRWLLGSTATHIVRHAACSVLVARA